MSDVTRFRVAPSPTGEPHIGNIYTALVNQIVARKNGGMLIVRIEDTDQTRSTAESEQKILELFRWMGIAWDEGPDIGGPYGPYRQSERKQLYQDHARVLIDQGHAFSCFCTPARLEEMRIRQMKNKQNPRYDGLCLSLSDAERAERIARGDPYVIRLKVPDVGDCSFHDQIYGAISIPWSEVDMQVLIKSDGMATYHLANVVDDHLMKITDVVRGEEWISSTPKHLLLYRYFGYHPPRFAHLPILRNPDRTKLSKRKNPTSVSWFKARGYHPEAIRLFLSLPFLAMAKGDELMEREQLEARFSLTHVSRSGGVFDLEKLDWLNARWIRERMTAEAFRDWTERWALEDGRLRTAIDLARTRIKTLGDLPNLIGFLFASEVTPAKEAFLADKTDEATVARILVESARRIETVREWNATELEATMREMSAELNLKLRLVIRPLFIAISGQAVSLPLFESMALLGRAICRYRIRRARDLFDWKVENTG